MLLAEVIRRFIQWQADNKSLFGVEVVLLLDWRMGLLGIALGELL